MTRVRPLGVLVLLLIAGSARAAGAACAPPSSESGAVQALKDMFAAAKTDDAAAFHRAVLPTFYAYDNGTSFPGDSLFEFIRVAHAKGLRAEWSVTEPKVTMDCASALVTYVNRGALGSAAAMTPTTWLESAVVRYDDGAWRVAFLHSTRAEKGE